MAALYEHGVRIVATLPAGPAAPELAQLRAWAELTPAVTWVERAGAREEPSAPVFAVFSRGARRPLFVMRGWPRGYEFVGFVQSVYFASARAVSPRRRTTRPRVTLYTAPTCPHSPIQLRHLLAGLAAAAVGAPLSVVDATQVPLPTELTVGEVPFTVIEEGEHEARLVGVVAERELIAQLRLSRGAEVTGTPPA